MECSIAYKNEENKTSFAELSVIDGVALIDGKSFDEAYEFLGCEDKRGLDDLITFVKENLGVNFLYKIHVT